MSEGYVRDKKFGLVWSSMCLPVILALAAATSSVLLVGRARTLSNRAIRLYTFAGPCAKVSSMLHAEEGTILMLAGGYPFRKLQLGLTALCVEHVQSWFTEHVGPPDEAGILSPPYPETVNTIAAVTYIEPTLAAFLICWLCWEALVGGTCRCDSNIKATVAA
eukprot:CAMPEP_0185322856 /NCGR_PEP_ID=MMETSP1363-20130426/60511_1 /TAXON_ID=38817 /ORGANISM="Gephyrocapsa oceanica, Strain RCC1303" /LENGTH=162 /DNA_ID=CAMNT_0027921411 /DNA_START=17 /DNA_END=502 /DNA_ORIENTATION=-